MRGDPEEDHAAAVAGDAERVGDRLDGAGHLEDDVGMLAVVLRHERLDDVAGRALGHRNRS